MNKKCCEFWKPLNWISDLWHKITGTKASNAKTKNSIDPIAEINHHKQNKPSSAIENKDNSAT